MDITLAAPNDDVRFTVTANPEPDDPGSTHLLEMYSIATGELVERHITGDPYGFIEAFRETQNYSLEERLGEFGLEWEREQEERYR